MCVSVLKMCVLFVFYKMSLCACNCFAVAVCVALCMLCVICLLCSCDSFNMCLYVVVCV